MLSHACPDWEGARPDILRIGDTSGMIDLPRGYKVVDAGMDCQKGAIGFSHRDFVEKFKQGNECVYKFVDPDKTSTCHIRLGKDEHSFRPTTNLDDN